jgi:hypothetical protein
VVSVLVGESLLLWRARTRRTADEEEAARARVTAPAGAARMPPSAVDDPRALGQRPGPKNDGRRPQP